MCSGARGPHASCFWLVYDAPSILRQLELPPLCHMFGPLKAFGSFDESPCNVINLYRILCFELGDSPFYDRRGAIFNGILFSKGDRP